MHFSMNRKFLYDKLNIVSRAITVFSPLPALSGFLIQVDSDKIVLTGSDSNIIIRSIIYPGELNQLSIDTTGSIVLEAKYVLEIIRKMDCDIVDFDLVDALRVRISSENGKFSLNGMEAHEYPNIDLKQPSTHFSLKTTQLKEIVSQTVFACSDKDQRPVLTGVNFDARQNTLYCSATDSYRLARKTVDLSNDVSFNLTIPSKSLLEVVRSINDEQEIVDIYCDAKKAQFVFEKTVIQTRLLDGSFPEVDRIIPSESVATLTIDSREIASVIDRTNFNKKDHANIIKLECSSEICRIKTSSSEIGESDEILTNCEYQGEPLALSCNGTYMLDAIKALASQNVRFEFSGLMKPIRITNPDDDSTLMINLPVRSYD